VIPAFPVIPAKAGTQRAAPVIPAKTGNQRVATVIPAKAGIQRGGARVVHAETHYRPIAPNSCARDPKADA